MTKKIIATVLLLGILILGVSAKSASAHGFGMMRGQKLEAFTKLFNMSEEDLKKELQSGKTIVDIAKDKNISEDQLVNTIIDAKKQHLDQLVKEGKITQTQEDEWVGYIKQMVSFKVKNNLFWNKLKPNKNATQSSITNRLSNYIKL